MKHVTYGEKSLLVDDQAADTLLRYATVLARMASADTVDINALGPDGTPTIATFLLDTGAPLMAETTTTTMSDPDNSEAIAYMQSQIMRLSAPPPVVPADVTMPENFEDLNL